MHIWKTPAFWVKKIHSERNTAKTNEAAREEVRKRGFWFIDIPRTGSTSLKKQLGGVMDKYYTRENLRGDQSRIQDHFTYQRIRKFLGPQITDQIYFFSLIRNPWDRLFSIYNYRIENREIESITFESFVHQLESPRFMIKNSFFNSWHFMLSQLDYLCDENGSIDHVMIGKFEERDEFLKMIAEEIGLSLRPQVHHEKLSLQDEYRKHYTNAMIDIVNRYYRDEIQMFDYSFE